MSVELECPKLPVPLQLQVIRTRDVKPDSTAKSTHSIRWSLISVILAMSAFAVLVGLKETIAQARDNRLQLTLLSEELRQTSDDLTRMVRTYVVTGDRQYRQYFDEILAIRNGLSPRPQGINRIYWDLVSKDEERPLPYGERMAFLELLKEQGGCRQSSRYWKQPRHRRMNWLSSNTVR